MAWLRDRLPDSMGRRRSRRRGWIRSYIEAEAFAVFGYLSLIGHALGGRWTGARGFGPPGWITPGENWIEVLQTLIGIRGLWEK